MLEAMQCSIILQGMAVVRVACIEKNNNNGRK